jgi:hypothetical protein
MEASDRAYSAWDRDEVKCLKREKRVYYPFTKYLAKADSGAARVKVIARAGNVSPSRVIPSAWLAKHSPDISRALDKEQGVPLSLAVSLSANSQAPSAIIGYYLGL